MKQPLGGVGCRIKRLRKEQGLSQRALGGPGVTYAYVSRIEAGTRRPSIDALITIAERLGVTALYLMTGDAHAECPVCRRSG